MEGLVEQGNIAPDDTNIMDALADAYLQLGEHCEALSLLELSTSRSPEENPYKWCYLAQLQAGSDAVGSYQRGINLLSEQLAGGDEVILKNGLVVSFLISIVVDEGSAGGIEETNSQSPLQRG